jgi:sterol desaturase/sphingolipid hydroxylase (fatty acid hydroxylase superfamily)
MDAAALFEPTFSATMIVLAGMAAVALLESLIPLHPRGHWNRAHLKPNLALTFVTLGTNVFLNAALLGLVFWLESNHLGLLRWLSVPSLPAALIAILVLDLAFYAAHFSWHKIPSLWRIHVVHHSDPVMDVTTTIRQHPLEGLLRFAPMAMVVLALGPSPAAFAVYRVASALNALLEHANIGAPRALDRVLALVTTWPHMHKIHHSRVPAQTDSNYGNLFSFWDRLFGTYTPSWEGTKVSYGVEGYEDPAIQTTKGLLGIPFRNAPPTTRAAKNRESPPPGSACCS